MYLFKGIGYLLYSFNPPFHPLCFKIPDKYLKFGTLKPPLHLQRTIVAVSAVCWFRTFWTGKHWDKFRAHFKSVDKFPPGRSKMNNLPLNSYCNCICIKTLIFNNTLGISVKSVAEFRFSLIKRKKERSFSNFLIRSKKYFYLAVFNFRIFHNVFCSSYNLGNAGFVISSKQCRTVWSYYFPSFIV